MFGFFGINPSRCAASPQEPPSTWRRCFHITAGSSIPVLAIFVSAELMIGLLAVLCGLAITVEAARFIYPPLNQTLTELLRPVLKKGEAHGVTAATYMLLAGLVSFLLFDQHLAVAALLFLSVGDPFAALVGSRVGGPRLWRKSPWGSVALFASAAVLSLTLWATGVASPLWPLLAGGIVAATVEIMPIPLDDNLTVPLVSGGAMALMVG